MSLLRTAGPTAEPVSVAEAKLHMGVVHSMHDLRIAGLIRAARELAEHQTNRSIVDQEWTLTLDEFPPEIRLQMGRVTAISAVRYVDASGATITLDPLTFYLDNRGEYEQWLVPAYGEDWPVPRDQINAVQVVYRAGWTGGPTVPESVKVWMLLLIQQWYDTPTAGTEKQVFSQPRPFFDGLLDPIRVIVLG